MQVENPCPLQKPTRKSVDILTRGATVEPPRPGRFNVQCACPQLPMASSVSTWGRESAIYMEKGAFSRLAEEGQPAQLTEHAHRHRPLLLRGKMAGGCCPVTSSSLLLLPQGKRLDLNLRNAKMDLAGPRKAGIGRVWEGGQGVSTERVFMICSLTGRLCQTS